MSQCIFCGQPIGGNSSMRLYHLQDTGEEGYACPRCEQQLARQQERPAPSGEVTYPRPTPSPAAMGAASGFPNPSAVSSWDMGADNGPALAAALGTNGGNGQGRAAGNSGGRVPPAERDDPREHRPGWGHPGKGLVSPWIFGMKIFAWLLFALVVVGINAWGSAQAFQIQPLLGQVPWLAVFIPASLLLGFVITGSIMIFLNLAQDVRRIRKELDNR